MSGQMKRFNYSKYLEQLKTMPEPVMASELPNVELNLHGIREYARQRGVPISSLTDDEKQRFISSPITRSFSAY